MKNVLIILQLIPEIEKVYSFMEAPEAYAKVKSGHLRGKIVISMNKDNEKINVEDKK